MRLLYEAAAGTGDDWVCTLVTGSDMKSRQKNEEVVYAWAAAHARRVEDGAATTLPALAGMDEVAPLNENDLTAAAREAIANKARRSALLRLISFTLNARKATTLTWQVITSSQNRPARGRLLRILQKFSRSTGYTNYGDNYVESRLRLLLPGWSVTTTPAGLSPHEVSAELLDDAANDTIRPIIDIPIRNHLVDWTKRREETLCAAVVTMQELTGGEPVLNVNEQMLRRATANAPSIVVMKPHFAPELRVGISTGPATAEYARDWSHGILDCLLDYLQAARDMSVEAIEDVAAAVLDNNTDSPVYFYLTHDTE